MGKGKGGVGRRVTAIFLSHISTFVKYSSRKAPGSLGNLSHCPLRATPIAGSAAPSCISGCGKSVTKAAGSRCGLAIRSSSVFGLLSFGVSGVERGQFQVITGLDPVPSQAVRLSDTFDHLPRVLRGRVVFDRYRPQSLARANGMLLRRPSGTGRGADVESADHDSRKEQARRSPAPINIVVFLHPRIIRNGPRFPNGLLSNSSTVLTQRRG